MAIVQKHCLPIVHHCPKSANEFCWRLSGTCESSIFRRGHAGKFPGFSWQQHHGLPKRFRRRMLEGGSYGLRHSPQTKQDGFQAVFGLDSTCFFPSHHVHLPLWMTFQLIKSFSGSFSERRNRHPKKYHPILLKYWYLPFTFILSLLFICAQHWHHGLCASLARSFSTFGRL